MPVTMTVSQVRAELYRAAGAQEARGDGSPSIAILGQWFHDAIGWLVGETAEVSPLAVLSEAEEDLQAWKNVVAACAYSRFVGPRLTSNQAALHDAAPQVLSFWTATRAACDWLAELAWNIRPKRHRSGLMSPPWVTLSKWLTTEEPLTCELREPGWTDSVRLVGIADAIIRIHRKGEETGSQRPNVGAAANMERTPDEDSAWCAIEFKLGQTSPVADLGQACLYHLLVSSARADEPSVTQNPNEAGSLALISFQPERHEQLFSAADLAGARQRLIELIGRLAGVAPTSADGTGNAPNVRKSPDSSVPVDTHGRNDTSFSKPTTEHLQLGQRLIDTLTNEYGVKVSLDGPPLVGPTFLRFPIKLGPRMRVAAVQQRSQELQLRLRLLRPPFIAVEQGSLVVDVQRPDRQKVFFDDIRPQLPAADAKLGGSHVPVGVDISGRLICADLATTEHCHLLVAGTTGSGKSEWLRSAIAGLIVTNTPATLRLLIIDPKRNAFHALRNSPYLWQPLVFPDERSVIEVLRDLVTEMDNRYRQLDGADSHAQLVARTDAPLPRIVCVCDEYRDLISRGRAERKQIEELICRLGAKARAAGIHLILATQEPRRETIQGPLDSNIPGRVGLWMQKAQESRMLLSDSGAENLLGHGDLLFKDVGPPRRLQAPLLTEANREAIFGV